MSVMTIFEVSNRSLSSNNINTVLNNRYLPDLKFNLSISKIFDAYKKRQKSKFQLNLLLWWPW